jgi:Arc/MetJ-type ribon-helix-helix transcriptional regulator
MLEGESLCHRRILAAGSVILQVMELALTPELEARIQRQLESGRFESAEQLVSTAVEVFESFPLPGGLEQAEFQRLLEEGCAEADRGETVSAEEAREHLRRLRAAL